MNGTNGVSALDRMAHEFLRNDVLVTLSHRAEVLGPYKRHSLRALLPTPSNLDHCGVSGECPMDPAKRR
jgi:hypothetical protein